MSANISFTGSRRKEVGDVLSDRAIPKTDSPLVTLSLVWEILEIGSTPCNAPIAGTVVER
jgi:hypothetical protein